MESQRKTFRALVLTCLLGLPAGAAWSHHSEIGPSDLLNEWNNRLQTARTHLLAGEHRQALDIARPLQHEMMNRIEDGPGASQALAITVLSRALAEAGLGDMDAAAWDWDVAQSLDPAISSTDLASFGAAGAVLQSFGPVGSTEELPGPEDVLDSSRPCNPKKETCVQKPELLSRSDLTYPDALQATCAEGSVLVASIIDEEGKIRHPRMKESPGGPVMSLAALESLRNWRFRPATLEGKPVKVYYTLTVNFKATSKGCLERRG